MEQNFIFQLSCGKSTAAFAFIVIVFSPLTEMHFFKVEEQFFTDICEIEPLSSAQYVTVHNVNNFYLT